MTHWPIELSSHPRIQLTWLNIQYSIHDPHWSFYPHTTWPLDPLIHLAIPTSNWPDSILNTQYITPGPLYHYTTWPLDLLTYPVIPASNWLNSILKTQYITPWPFYSYITWPLDPLIYTAIPASNWPDSILNTQYMTPWPLYPNTTWPLDLYSHSSIQLEWLITQYITPWPLYPYPTLPLAPWPTYTSQHPIGLTQSKRNTWGWSLSSFFSSIPSHFLHQLQTSITQSFIKLNTFGSSHRFMEVPQKRV